MTIRFVDEHADGFGWQAEERARRTSHALSIGGDVWVFDPIEGDGVEERLYALGEPVGVVQLLDRHNRACDEFATRLGVPLHVVPSALPVPFELLPVRRNRIWAEVALWWPERRLLLCADAFGTVPFFRAGDEPVGLHPFLRLRPPRSLRGLGVERLLVGHGEGMHGEGTAAAVEDALRSGRRRIPRYLVGLPRVIRQAH